jgi:hypothetical protein
MDKASVVDGVKVANKDDRDILEVLKAELDFVDKGGYACSVRAPWMPVSIFRDSPTCVNFGDPERARPCSECPLMEFVPPEHRSESVPCHRIPLNRYGQSVADLTGGQIDQEEALRMWLCSMISRIERLRDE